MAEREFTGDQVKLPHANELLGIAQLAYRINISEEVFKVEELLFNIGLPNPIKEIREEIEKMEKIKEENNVPIKVFVTYSWADEYGNFDEENQNKTGTFVNQLRTKWGLDASFDLHKEENNFVKMMYENISKSDKIIIIFLSLGSWL